MVETTGWNRWHGDYEPIYLSENAKVTERFTRTGKDEILYEFAVDDPGFYTQPWKGEMVFTPSERPGLRIRLPRRQLRAARHPGRRADQRGERREEQGWAVGRVTGGHPSPFKVKADAEGPDEAR